MRGFDAMVSALTSAYEDNNGEPTGFPKLKLDDSAYLYASLSFYNGAGNLVIDEDGEGMILIQAQRPAVRVSIPHRDGFNRKKFSTRLSQTSYGESAVKRVSKWILKYQSSIEAALSAKAKEGRFENTITGAMSKLERFGDVNRQGKFLSVRNDTTEVDVEINLDSVVFCISSTMPTIDDCLEQVGKQF